MHVTYSKGIYTVTASLADWRDLLLESLPESGFIPVASEVCRVGEAERDNPNNADVDTESLTIVASIQPEDWHSFVPHAVRLGLVGRGITVDTLPTDTDRLHRSDACRFACRGKHTRTLARGELWRVNGQTRLWKRDASRFRIPVKVGYHGPYGYLDDANQDNWHRAEDCPFGL
jgi:hypothetical protein